MKKTFILILSLGFLFSCNNKGGGWPSADENKWMNSCMGQMGTTPNAKDICSCILQKAEKTFPTYQQEETQGTEQQGEQWARECMNASGGNKGGGMFNNKDNNNNNNNNNNGNNGDENGNNNNNNNNGNTDGGERGWTNAQRNQLINECTPSAEQAQGFS